MAGSSIVVVVSSSGSSSSSMLTAKQFTYLLTYLIDNVTEGDVDNY